MSGIVEVLHGLNIPWGGRVGGFIHIDANAAHAIKAALTDAGFGPIAEAKAQALEDAAKALDRIGDGDTQAALSTEWLRVRAAAVRAAGCAEAHKNALTTPEEA